jgi:hypothetical protein
VLPTVIGTLKVRRPQQRDRRDARTVRADAGEDEIECGRKGSAASGSASNI